MNGAWRDRLSDTADSLESQAEEMGLQFVVKHCKFLRKKMLQNINWDAEWMTRRKARAWPQKQSCYTMWGGLYLGETHSGQGRCLRACGGARERSFRTIDGTVRKKEDPSEKNNPFRQVQLPEFETESSGSFWRYRRSPKKRGQGKQRRLGFHLTEAMTEVKDSVVGGRYNASTKTWDR